MWTVALFAPTGLFSLRPAQSTASGAQTLLVPTPFAVKMALLDAAISGFGLETGKLWWTTIRDANVALAVPDVLVVNKTFIKVQRQTDPPKQKGVDRLAYTEQKIEEGKWPFGPTIAFREFVQFGGELGLAVQARSSVLDVAWDRLLTRINYLGKRGSFLQLQALPSTTTQLGDGWTMLTRSAEAFPINGTLQLLDDCGSSLTWSHVDVYDTKSMKLNNNERVLRHIVLPYELKRSSRGFSLYERIS